MFFARRSRLVPLAILSVLLVAAGGSFMLLGGRDEDARPSGPQLVFAEFGARTDRIYSAPASDPARRTLITTVDHADEWGLNPGLAPAGTLVAFTALPPGSRPQPDTPADLWLLDVATKSKRRLAGDADLRIAPVFDRDGRYLLYRASASGGQQRLVRLEVANGAQRTLHTAETAFGIFPIGFDAGGAVLYASISNRGSDVYRLAEGEERTLLFHASDEVARDWRLSPDGTAIAFNAPAVTAERVYQRLHVVRIEGTSATEIPATTPASAPDQYGVAWRPSGDAVTVGNAPAGPGPAPATDVPLTSGTPLPLATPPRGFDRPLLWSDDGNALVVQSFEGTSATDPGSQSTVVISGAQRLPVTGTGDILVFGWIEYA
jgi:Tol biopolymer transport system component